MDEITFILLYKSIALIIFIFSSLAKRLAGKSISDMTCLVSSGTLNLKSVSQSVQLICCVAVLSE